MDNNQAGHDLNRLPTQKPITPLVIKGRANVVEIDITKNLSSKKVEDNGYILLCGHISKETRLAHGDSFLVKHPSSEINIETDENTTIIKSEFTVLDELGLVFHVAGEQCLADIIADKEYLNMFKSFDSLNSKIDAIRQFLTFPKQQQENIRTQLNGERYSVTDVGVINRTKGIENLRLRYQILKSTFRPQQQADIEGILDDFRHLPTNRLKAERKLDYILNICTASSGIERFTKSQIITELDKYLFGLHELKVRLAETIIAKRFSQEKGFAVLLVGSPGVGKTAIAKAFAQAIKKPFIKIPVGSCTSKVDVSGDAPQYDGSDVGEVVKAFYKVGQTDVVFLLDEFDDTDEEMKEGRVSKAFNDMLSDEHFFKDQFLGTYINTHNTKIIATANSTENIPQHLLNRFTVIHIGSYNDNDKIQIAKKHILPEIAESLNIQQNEVSIGDSAIKNIAVNFCEDDGVRDMKKHLESIMHRIIADWVETGVRKPVVIDEALVGSCLSEYVDENSPIIFYRRNRTLYSDETANEIERLIVISQKNNLEPHIRETSEKQLRYLVKLIPVGEGFKNFSVDEFYNRLNSTHYGLETIKDMVAKTFYTRVISGKPLTGVRLLFIGPPGIGKSSIIKSIAEACHSACVKISLNGVTDEAVIKGHSKTYIGSDAGEIVRKSVKAGTTKLVIQLDEIDKIGSKEGVSVSNSLIDFLDDSAEFFDYFLGNVHINFSDALICATANDVSSVNPLLLDRFTVINLDGYTNREKIQITSDYIIPQTISELCPSTAHISFSDEAIISVNEHCTSLGVRDIDKAVHKVVCDKLFNTRNETDRFNLLIDAKDVYESMGNPPIPRGNFPQVPYVGLTRALAVIGGTHGMDFAVESVIVPGDSSLNITGLPKESVIDSVKIAISYIKRHFYDELGDVGLHVHFGEGATPKDGPSAGVAIFVSLLSMALNVAVDGDIAYTGEINLNGNIFAVGGIKAKIQAAEKAKCSMVFIPKQNYNAADIDDFSIEVVPVEHITEIIDRLFTQYTNLPVNRGQ